MVQDRHTKRLLAYFVLISAITSVLPNTRPFFKMSDMDDDDMYDDDDYGLVSECT